MVIVSRQDIGLGAEGVGILNTAYAFFGIFSIVSAGMSQATSQIVSSKIFDKKVAFEYARNGTFIIIVTDIVIGIGLIIASFIIDLPVTFQHELSSIFFIIGIVMLIAGVRDGIVSNLAAVGEYDDIVKAYTTFPLSQVLSVIVLLILIKTMTLPVGLILIVYVVGVIVQLHFLFKYFRHLWFNTQIFRFNKVDRRVFGIMRQGFYFAVTNLIPSGIVGSIATIILLIFTQNYQIVGAFSIILGYSMGGLIVTGFAWPLITSVAEAYGENNTEKIHYYLHLIVKIYFYVTFFTLTLNIGLSRGILSVFHGEIYVTGVTDVWIPFILVISAFAIAGFEYVLCSVLLGIGKGRIAAIYLGSVFLSTVGFVSLFLGLGFFSPQINAAVGFLIATLVMAPFLPHIVKKNVNETISFSIGWKSLVALICTISVAAVLTWPPLMFLPFNNLGVLILIAILLTVIYPCVLVFFGAVSEEDFELFERKMEEYGLKKIISPILNFFRKIARISPF